MSIRNFIFHRLGDCKDLNAGCSGWRSLCSSNAYVKRNCQKTCNTCEGVVTTPTTKISTRPTTKTPTTTTTTSTTTKTPTTITTKRPVTTKVPTTKTTKGPVIPLGGMC